MAGSALVDFDVPQDFSDVVAETVVDALVADEKINRLCHGVGGLAPPTDPADLATRVPTGLGVGETYREGHVNRSELSLAIPGVASPSIAVSVFNRESASGVGHFEGNMQIALRFTYDVFHRILERGEPSTSGFLKYVEVYLSSLRHQLLCENAYGGVALVSVFNGFQLNDVGVDEDTGTLKSFQMIIDYTASRGLWENVPERI